MGALLALVFAFATSTVALAQQPKSPPSSHTKGETDADTELQKALLASGNDRSALVRNLKNYLERFPDSPRKANVFQAIVEACQQLRDDACALEYAERLIAVQPDDSDMMMLATDLLEQKGDDAALTRAAGYVTRVLDRVEKASPTDKPPLEPLAEWRERRGQLRTALYFVRGKAEKSLHNNDEAEKDLRTSYAIDPNARAAELLGELAESRGDLAGAIDEFARAFVLPETGPAGKIDRRQVRNKLGSLWRQVHSSDEGLGDEILSAYDHLTPASADRVNPPPNGSTK